MSEMCQNMSFQLDRGFLEYTFPSSIFPGTTMDNDNYMLLDSTHSGVINSDRLAENVS